MTLGNPFFALMAIQKAVQDAIVAPLVFSPLGEVEDSAHYFPTLGGLFRKAVLGDRGLIS